MAKQLSFVVGLLVFGAVACATAGSNAVGGDDVDGGGNVGDDSGTGSGGDAGHKDGGGGGTDAGGGGTDAGGGTDSGNPQDSGGTCTKAPVEGGVGACGVAPQCGCAANQTCDVTSLNGATACVNAGTGAQGTACTGTGGCAAGLTCVFGACHPYCGNPGSQCAVANTGLCYQVQNQQMQNIPNLDVCLIKCALDDPNSCGGLPSNQSDPVAGCLPDNAGNTDCETAGRSTTSCGANGTAPYCAPGWTCANNGTSNLCVKWCKVGGANLCGGAQTCHSFQTHVVISGQEFGYCQ